MKSIGFGVGGHKRKARNYPKLYKANICTCCLLRRFSFLGDANNRYLVLFCLLNGSCLKSIMSNVLDSELPSQNKYSTQLPILNSVAFIITNLKRHLIYMFTINQKSLTITNSIIINMMLLLTVNLKYEYSKMVSDLMNSLNLM